jgi:hypothetical protein
MGGSRTRAARLALAGPWLVPAFALASGPEPGAVPRIYGGEPAPTCGWPTTIALDNCSGTLIHLEVAAYAAHCGAGPSGIRFGNSQGAPDRDPGPARAGTATTAIAALRDRNCRSCRIRP